MNRLNLRLRCGTPIKTHHEDGLLRTANVVDNINLHTRSFNSSNKHLDRPNAKDIKPYDPNDAPASKDLRTPFVPNKQTHSLWKTAKDGVKNQISTAEYRREVKHPSLFYRQDHKDIGHLFKAGGIAGHDHYKGYKPRSNNMVISLSLMALLVHAMTREENDIDDMVQRQGWYRLLWLNAPYDSSKDPRSNKEVGKTIIGVPLISENTLLNNTKDE